MDITLGRVLPAGIGDYTTRLAEQLNRGGAGAAPGAPGAAPITADPLASGAAGVTAPGTVGSADGVAGSFSRLLAQALQDVNQVHHAADADANRLVAGEPVDIHQVMIGMEKANVAFGLTVQVRNKLIEAYQEIMRMQV